MEDFLSTLWRCVENKFPYDQITYDKTDYFYVIRIKNAVVPSKVPSKVASFRTNAEAYSGNCMRRTSTTLLANKGADLTTIKQHGG
ncbi:hypothetical protein NQ317_011088 [Molorchus minor]|uniref:Uncharacterized protein n=1 Tax=Molorchus minor TaxID=1323400 RepID=A0ABQ9JUS4_9CUCU|nr:hypothetical protein NQ317_011088 [Molorchus minor]